MTRDEIFTTLKDILVEDFEIDASLITLDATLYQGLDLDSIDAVDLVIKLQQISGKKIKPEEFRTVRTVKDVVDAVEKLMAS